MVRGYNLLVIIIAQYLTSIFILSKSNNFIDALLDAQLLCLILATVITIASGYIINNFYDSEKDLINRPQKSKIDRLISQQTKLVIYFIFNFVAVIIASYVSFKAVLFFSFYIFGIWFYSHKLKHFPFVGNVVATVLAIFPFFAIFIYYHNYDSVIFVHAVFLVLILLMREMVKDLENIVGDISVGRVTVPIKYGELYSKKILAVLTLVSISTAMVLAVYFPLGKMSIYFLIASLCLIAFGILLFRASTKHIYILLHNILKFIIVLGVFSILLVGQ